ncbi:MAG TPA: PAS domain S-box protein [Candidatus Hydrogenedentes bacterium]|nr:PAS domain S-box protein [Candidatus Hydrogenedentota bacterium]
MESSRNAATSWQRPRIGWSVVVFVVLGTLFEFGSIYADDFFPSPHKVGNFLSLASGIFMALALLTITRRLAEDRVSRGIILVAASLFVFSKVLACTVEYKGLRGVPVFGRDGFGHDILEDYTYTIALVMILFGFIRSALEANKARYTFGLQNVALKREVEQRAEVERALRASEALYRDLVDTIPDVVWRVDKTGTFTFVSPSVETAFGISPDNVVGKRLGDVFPKDVAERTQASIAQRVSGESWEAGQGFQFNYVRPDGGVRSFESLSAPVYDSDGRVVEIQGVSRDITAYIEANEALAASEEKYRVFVENSPLVMARVNRDMKYVFVNRAYLEAVRLTQEAVVGKGPEVIEGVMHPDDFPVIVGYVKEALESQERRTTEVRMMDAEGRWRWFLHLVYPWYEPNGRLGGIETLARDVTERRLAEEALRKSEETARALLNATSDHVGLIDHEGRLLALNEHLAGSFGKSPSDLVGADIRELLNGETAVTRWRNMRAVLRTGRPLRFSDEYKGRHFEHCFYPVGDENGEFTRLAFYSRDMTDSLRKEEERVRLAKAIEQAPDSVIVTGTDGVIQYVNPGFERNTGYTRQEVAGQTTRFLRSTEHAESFYRTIEDTISRGAIWSGRLVSRRKGGSLFESDATISPVHNDAGVIINHVWLIHDVSTEVSLERQLLQAQKMEAVGTLAGGIAHDFNNILSLILGHSELLLEAIPDNEIARFNVRQITRAGNRGAELVKQILTFSRQVERRCELCNVGTILKEALRFLAASLPATVEIQQHIEDETGAVMADPIQIYQVVMNLCTNAYQAMGTEGGILELGVDEVEIGRDFQADVGSPGPGKYVRLTVSDTGTGIDPAVIGRMFEPFYSTKKPSQGTGLGLSTVHGIVTGYGGAVRVHSAVGEGSVFEVFLPQVEAGIPLEAAPEEFLVGGSERILFVDDDADLTQMAGMLLHHLGYTVETFSNSMAAFEAFSSSPESFDLAIVDQIMPHLMGVELAKRMLQRRPGFPVFLLTGYSEGITPEQARDLGIREFIMKPFSSRELGTLIRKALDGVDAQRN